MAARDQDQGHRAAALGLVEAAPGLDRPVAGRDRGLGFAGGVGEAGEPALVGGAEGEGEGESPGGPGFGGRAGRVAGASTSG